MCCHKKIQGRYHLEKQNKTKTTVTTKPFPAIKTGGPRFQEDEFTEQKLATGI